MLHTKLLRSPLPHAKIVKINISRAQKLPGVVEILTGNTLCKNGSWESHYGPVMRDQGIVAVDNIAQIHWHKKSNTVFNEFHRIYKSYISK